VAPAPPPPPPPPPPMTQRREEAPSFPWPPPRASADMKIPRRWLAEGTTTPLSEVADRLERALEAAKYRSWSYSSVPHGFALITQMERIREDGTPSPEPARWSADLPSVGDLTLLEFVKALAHAPRGYYRVVVFVVTDSPWRRSGRRPTRSEARRWLTEGYESLPANIGDHTYRRGFNTTALVYEFQKDSQRRPAVYVESSPVPARDHLDKAGILEPLSEGQ
jgi:hypothetical protein